MLHVFSRNKAFYILWMLALCGASILVYMHSNHGLQVILNGYNNPFFDVLFYYLTKLAEGILITMLLVYTLFKSRAHLFSLIGGWSLAALFTQLLKKTLFSHVPRPGKIFQLDPNWHWVEGVTIHNSASFPSGHTTDVFAVMTLVALYSKNNLVGTMAFFLAAFVAYSRIYLSQHFMLDLIAGSSVGVFFASLSVFFFFYSEWAKHRIDMLCKPLIKLK